MSNKKLAPVYGTPTKCYDSARLISELGLDDDGRIADFYCHFSKCNWVIQERKGANHVQDALEQIESTATQLGSLKQPIHETQIIMPKLSPNEAKIYSVYSQTHSLRYKGLTAGPKIPYVTTPVKVFFEKELEESGKRSFDWDSVSG